jgi:hypothetical protein
MPNEASAVPQGSALRLLLGDSLWYCGALGALTLGSLYVNPEIWYSDYPAEIRARFGPPSARSQQQKLLLVPVLLLVVFGGLVVSLRRLRRARGGRLGFRAALLHTWGLFNAFNLFDAVILDYVILLRLQPRFARLPGTEDMDMAQYVPVSRQVQDFGKGLIFSAVVAPPVAWMMTRNEE